MAVLREEQHRENLISYFYTCYLNPNPKACKYDCSRADPFRETWRTCAEAVRMRGPKPNDSNKKRVFPPAKAAANETKM